MAKSLEMSIANTGLRKRKEHLIIYKSRAKFTAEVTREMDLCEATTVEKYYWRKFRDTIAIVRIAAENCGRTTGRTADKKDTWW